MLRACSKWDSAPTESGGFAPFGTISSSHQHYNNDEYKHPKRCISTAIITCVSLEDRERFPLLGSTVLLTMTVLMGGRRSCV